MLDIFAIILEIKKSSQNELYCLDFFGGGRPNPVDRFVPGWKRFAVITGIKQQVINPVLKDR